MTSKGDDVASKLQGEFSGMRYLAKPFEPDELLALLDLVLA
jgi:DNA-binding response OmpR family regulator